VVIDGTPLRRGLDADFVAAFSFFFLLAGIGSLETSWINLVHPQHGSQPALSAGGIGIGEHLAESLRA
jgi:hypothetical protein